MYTRIEGEVRPKNEFNENRKWHHQNFNFFESRIMFGTVGFVGYRIMGLTLFVSKYLLFSELKVTIVSPRTVLNIRFRPRQAYLFGMGGKIPKIWRHHKPEVTSLKFQLSRIPSSWIPMDWLTATQSEHSGGGGTFLG